MRLVFWLIVLISCGSQSLEEYRDEGNEVVSDLTQELRTVHSRHDLLQKSQRVKQLFNKLAEIMIAAQHWHQHHPESPVPDLSATDHLYSEQLRTELNRLYRIDGVRDLLEKCQQPALERIDNFEKRKKASK